jgi:hypothetical protein
MSDDLAKILDVHRTPSPFKRAKLSPLEKLALTAYDPPSYKHVVVNMRGVNGNTMVIVGTVKLALKRAGASALDLSMFVAECLAHDYEHALATVCTWVTITDEAPAPTDDAWSGFLKVAGQEKGERE